jgi:UPF0716 protein FxsA
MWVFLVLIGVPLIEIGLFVTLGAWLGLGVTLAIVIGSAVLGVWIIRAQGLRARIDLRSAIAAGRNPLPELAGDAFRVVAGALLILPGFLTDTLGLLLLLPPVQGWISQLIARQAMSKTFVTVGGHRPSRGPGAARQPDVIDATWEELPEDDARRPKGPPSGWTRD